MRRFVTAELDLTLAGSADLIFSLSAHPDTHVSAESLTFVQDGAELASTELVEPNGTRLHRLRAEPGALDVRYRAEAPRWTPADGISELDAVTYLRPSRYAESDALFGDARRRFRGLAGVDLLDAVRAYVNESLAYAPDGSIGTDSAVTTLAKGRGVCRDFAHSAIALLRAMDVPARYVSCYAPGLVPMDFHAVCEAYLDGAWHVIDGTGLAPREHLVRIGTGRDAADCAFLSYYGANLTLQRLSVDAWLEADGIRVEPEPDDPTRLVRIA